jgi:uncharacterized protein YcsI (UPF0317 family)
MNNPKPCPLLDVCIGNMTMNHRQQSSSVQLTSKRLAWEPNNLLTDVGEYTVFSKNNDQVNRIITRDPIKQLSVLNKSNHSTNIVVGFLLGCSFSWEDELIRVGIKDVVASNNVPMYKTSIDVIPSGIFSKGKLVVSYRVYRKQDIIQVIDITSKFPFAHGAPVHVGPSHDIGISMQHLSQPNWGSAPNLDVVRNHAEEVIGCFWACGVTPQTVIEHAIENGNLEWAITHRPGTMFITDVLVNGL